MKKLLFILSVLFIGCKETETEELVTPILDTVSPIEVDSIVKDTMFEKIESLMKSTEHASRKVKEIKVLKTENYKLKTDLVETKVELLKAHDEIKKLDSAVNQTKKRSLLQKIVDNFKDTIK